MFSLRERWNVTEEAATRHQSWFPELCNSQGRGEELCYLLNSHQGKPTAVELSV